MRSTYTILLILAVFLTSCKNTNTTKEKATTIPIDTIQTKSGLRYFYIKHGDGPKVESGDEVGTYLSLMVNDSVVWNSNTQPDSLYTFTANKSRVIKGFNEMVNRIGRGPVISFSCGYGFTVVATAKYTGETEEELIKRLEQEGENELEDEGDQEPEKRIQEERQKAAFEQNISCDFFLFKSFT